MSILTVKGRQREKTLLIINVKHTLGGQKKDVY